MEDSDVKLRLALAGLGLALLAASVRANGADMPAAVDAQASITRDATPAVVTSRGLEGLSPGNRLIAQALFNAQKAVTVGGRHAWSLERVAVARTGGSNWGEVFQQMKRDGLIEAETLGQVVTWYQYHQATTQAPPAGAMRDAAAAVAGVTPQPISAK
jgi:hypothetical protein